MLSFCGYLFPEARVVVYRERVAEDFDRDCVVETGDALHEVGGRMVAEIGGEISDSQSPPTHSETLGETVGGFVEGDHLE